MKHLKTFESHNNIALYHGSMSEFPIGFELLPQEDGYVHDEGSKIDEDFLEKFRPSDKLSRFKSVYLIDDIDLIEDAGGYEDFIYEVSYDYISEKSDLAWYSEMSMAEDMDRKEECAKNYWSGIIFEELDYSLFEYRVPSAKIIRTL